MQPDPFADAKAKIRETVKWLATAFAALATFLIGSAPISGLGNVAWDSPRFWVGLSGLIGGLAATFGALWLVLRILRPEMVYRSELLGTDDSAPEGVRWVRRQIAMRANDVMPYGYSDLDELAQGRVSLQGNYPALQKFDKAIFPVLALASYLRLQHRLERTLPRLFVLGFAILACLLAYGVSTAGSKLPRSGSESAKQIFILGK
jgi:cytochrome c biogenesis protein CcdA